MTASQPTTLLEAIQYFSDDDRAFQFFVSLRWPTGQPVCPRCGCLEHSFLTTRHTWKCRACHKQFSIKVGTIFEDSPVPLSKWLPAVWMIANSKNSISSHELGRALGVTQKTSWFMLHRIRLAMEAGTFEQMDGTVEVDETYVGARGDNVHRYVVRTRGLTPKTPVQGARQRETGTVRAAVLPKGRAFKANVYEWVKAGSTVYTDEHKSYWGLSDTYAHSHVTHGGSSSRRYVFGDVHTNGIENFWALLKRAIKGTQTHAAPEHLHRYVAERTFAYNYRTDSDLERMRTATIGIAGRRLTWAQLTNKA